MKRSSLLVGVALLVTAATSAAQEARLVTVKRTASFGGPGGGSFEISCPYGTVMTGLRARHGEWIDALAPICSKYVRGVGRLGETNAQPFTGGNGGATGFLRCQEPRGVVVGLVKREPSCPGRPPRRPKPAGKQMGEDGIFL